MHRDPNISSDVPPRHDPDNTEFPWIISPANLRSCHAAEQGYDNARKSVSRHGKRVENITEWIWLRLMRLQYELLKADTDIAQRSVHHFQGSP